jgi:protein-disulfide isomerase
MVFFESGETMSSNWKLFKSISTLAVVFMSLQLSACSPSATSLKKTLKENPDILVEAIKENPADIMLALSEAQRLAQSDMAKKREEEEKKELEKAFETPLTPEIRSDESFMGSKDAPITIVEYTDFQCPYCKKGADNIKEVMQRHKGKVRVVLKHLPFQQNSMPAALHYEAIRLQSPDKAWSFYDRIFKEQARVREGEKFFKEVAKAVGANMARLDLDIKSDEVMSRIQQDMQEAEKFGITGTPGFVVNGVPIRGAYPPDYFDFIIEELKKRGKLSI